MGASDSWLRITTFAGTTVPSSARTPWWISGSGGSRSPVRAALPCRRNITKIRPRSFFFFIFILQCHNGRSQRRGVRRGAAWRAQPVTNLQWTRKTQFEQKKMWKFLYTKYTKDNIESSWVCRNLFCACVVKIPRYFFVFLIMSSHTKERHHVPSEKRHSSHAWGLRERRGWGVCGGCGDGCRALISALNTTVRTENILQNIAVVSCVLGCTCS